MKAVPSISQYHVKNAPDDQSSRAIDERHIRRQRLKLARVLLTHIESRLWTDEESCLRLGIDPHTLENLYTHDLKDITVESMLLCLWNCGLTVDYHASRCLDLEYSTVTASLALNIAEQKLLIWRTCLQPTANLEIYSAKELVIWMAIAWLVENDSVTLQRLAQISWSSVFSYIEMRPIANFFAKSLVIDLESNHAAIYADPFRPDVGEQDNIAIPLRPFIERFDVSSFIQI